MKEGFAQILFRMHNLGRNSVKKKGSSLSCPPPLVWRLLTVCPSDGPEASTIFHLLSSVTSPPATWEAGIVVPKVGKILS